jgi:hypothetical protein
VRRFAKKKIPTFLAVAVATFVFIIFSPGLGGPSLGLGAGLLVLEIPKYLYNAHGQLFLHSNYLNLHSEWYFQIIILSFEICDKALKFAANYNQLYRIVAFIKLKIEFY